MSLKKAHEIIEHYIQYLDKKHVDRRYTWSEIREAMKIVLTRSQMHGAN